MMIRKALTCDLSEIMKIVDAARKYFAENNIPQWQEEYPAEKDFSSDIEGDRLFVAENDGKVLGVYCYDTRGDKNYDKIYEGSFRQNSPYAAIHRVAVSPEAKGQGIGGLMVSHAVSLAKEQGFSQMRGDTHRLNISMQRMLTKNGFQKRGIIYLDGKKDEKNERFVFDMLFSEV